ncbi:MAG: GMC family oxidoreductase N-terminal domain-containing protein [Sphingobium sp.]|nr:GMC family oxidoreductase N-terminal domain-containing protein [Sphingobium sp.]
MTPEFDYIVVGSGSAGAVVAARLCEDKNVSVLLLEAGPRDRHPLQLMPLAFARVAAGNIGTWQYLSEPEPELNGRQLAIPRGRTLGGTSSINAMIAIRGHRLDYDGWAAQGLPGWSHEAVLPNFKKLERSWRGAGPYHGADGPVAISLMEGPDLLWEPLLAAARAAGIAYNDDANGAEQDGISRMESTVAGGRRVSAARAYLYPAMRRPNLTIVTGALAGRVIVERGRATGIEYLRASGVETAQAAREVILCGGAYNSPQLLLLSGIGPADELRTLGIEPVHDLPGVGRNLADHPNIINEYALIGDEGLTRHLRADRAALSLARWFARASGPFAYTGTMANIFARSLEGLAQPDIQMMAMPISGSAQLWFRKPVSRISVRTGYLQPKSRGWVRLRSADPRDPPRIFNNMYAEPGDLDAMVRALRLSRSIYAQSPMRELIRHETLPGAEAQGDAELRAHIRAHGTHRSHPVGTCRMGIGGDAVVDGALRVYGLEGLRIADASIMPSIPSGNTNLPVMMIGEKAADLILGR